jgi:hypothetical protein
MAFSTYVAIGLLILPLLLIGTFLLIAFAVFIFEIAMFVHAIRSRTISDERKILWLIGMLFIHPLVAIAYCFTDYPPKH